MRPAGSSLFVPRKLPPSTHLYHIIHTPSRTRRRPQLQVCGSTRTLLIDNYDSYTYNLYQLLAEVNSELPTVCKNDSVSYEDIRHLIETRQIDNIVISPGPGSPSNPTDIGVCLDILKAATDVPVLGVCLGHQALAHVHGASVCRAPQPVHGKLSTIHHNCHPLFAGIPNTTAFEVVRYHSLLVDESSLPPCLEAIAWTHGDSHSLSNSSTPASRNHDPSLPHPSLPYPSAATDYVSNVHRTPEAAGLPCRSPSSSASTPPSNQGQRLLMALSHRHYPHYGVQFHPESIATKYGREILQNFRNITQTYTQIPPSTARNATNRHPVPKPSRATQPNTVAPPDSNTHHRVSKHSTPSKSTTRPPANSTICTLASNQNRKSATNSTTARTHGATSALPAASSADGTIIFTAHDPVPTTTHASSNNSSHSPTHHVQTCTAPTDASMVRHAPATQVHAVHPDTAHKAHSLSMQQSPSATMQDPPPLSTAQSKDAATAVVGAPTVRLAPAAKAATHPDTAHKAHNLSILQSISATLQDSPTQSTAHSKDAATAVAGAAGAAAAQAADASSQPVVGLCWVRVPLSLAADKDEMFWELFGGGPDTFWLDSSSAPERGRYSFMGGKGGSLWRRVTYSLPRPPSTPNTTKLATSPTNAAVDFNAVNLKAENNSLRPGRHLHCSEHNRFKTSHARSMPAHTLSTITNGADEASPQTLEVDAVNQSQRKLIVTTADGTSTEEDMSIFDYLAHQLAVLEVPPSEAWDLPFDFWGGFVGYLGYEMKAECGGVNAHPSRTPDAIFFLADRLLVLDHHSNEVYLLGVYERNDVTGVSKVAAEEWLASMQKELLALSCVHLVSSSTAANGVTNQDAARAQLPHTQRLQPDLTELFEPTHTQTPHGKNLHTQHSQPDLAELFHPAHTKTPHGKNLHTQHSQPDLAELFEPAHTQPPHGKPPHTQHSPPHLAELFEPVHTQPVYLKNIQVCKEALYSGDSYELCLTTAFQIDVGKCDRVMQYNTGSSAGATAAAAAAAAAATRSAQPSVCSENDNDNDTHSSVAPLVEVGHKSAAHAWSELSTSRLDISHMGAARDTAQSSIEAVRDQAQSSIEAVREERQSSIEAVRDQRQSRIEAVRDQRQSSIEAVREERQSRIEAVRDQAQSRIEAVRDQAQSSMEAVRDERQSNIEAVREERQSSIEAVRDQRQSSMPGMHTSDALNNAHGFDPRTFYRTLRRRNPAPYSAWMHVPKGPTICCSSPERFLRLDRHGTLEARPIKGTAPRSQDPEQDALSARTLSLSEKDRAENLMIVDLLRNDLGRVCQVGTVHVPELMIIESFATVHQMVSTVRGKKSANISVVDCIKAAFPAGSMTGAPKVRSMQLLDDIEGQARGVYSGSVGFISLNGTFDLNVVIRTGVIMDGVMDVGAGGAIVVQSDPEGEFEEMKLKARALLRTAADTGAVSCRANAAVQHAGDNTSVDVPAVQHIEHPQIAPGTLQGAGVQGPRPPGGAPGSTRRGSATVSGIGVDGGVGEIIEKMTDTLSEIGDVAERSMVVCAGNWGGSMRECDNAAGQRTRHVEEIGNWERKMVASGSENAGQYFGRESVANNAVMLSCSEEDGSDVSVTTKDKSRVDCCSAQC